MEIRSLLRKVGALCLMIAVGAVGGRLAEPATVAAQETTAELAWLTVDLWPDYDRPQVLVLLTGSLPPEVTPPVTLTVPVPEEATIHAVARIDAEDNLLADLDPQIDAGAVTFTLPDDRFRIEYYYPYEADGLSRSFTFGWRAPDLAVRALSLAVQQPAFAAELDTDPEAEMISEGGDQLSYYNLPDLEVPAGEPYVVDVTYTLSEDRLTVGPAADTPAAGGAAIPGTGGGLDLDWPLLLGVGGGLLILLALAWHLFGDRLSAPASTLRKPRPARVPQRPSGSGARFCHNCGEAAHPGDRFCRECGTKLKA